MGLIIALHTGTLLGFTAQRVPYSIHFFQILTVPVVLFEVGFKLDKVPVAGIRAQDGKTAVAVVFVLSSRAVMEVSVRVHFRAALFVVVVAFVSF